MMICAFHIIDEVARKKKGGRMKIAQLTFPGRSDGTLSKD
jgi:hypothetical protein